MAQKKPKLTKKMLTNLDKAELRIILMSAMGVRPEQAYQEDVKWCIGYVYDNQEEFAVADLSDIPVQKFRHPSVYTYVRKLQGYLSGSNEAPGWPPMTDGDEFAVNTQPKKVVTVVKKSVTEVPVVETAVEEAPVVETPAVEEVEEVPAQISFQKVAGLGNKSADPEVNDLGILIETVEMISTKVQETGEEVSKKFEGLRMDMASDIDRLNDRMLATENALMFIINSILPEGQILKSLKDVPKPPYN